MDHNSGELLRSVDGECEWVVGMRRNGVGQNLRISFIGLAIEKKFFGEFCRAC
jgi:hypothetical protein